MTTDTAPLSADVLREPKGDFQKLTRRLAEEAISLIHHDAAEPEYSHEIAALERRFGLILRGKIKGSAR